MSMKEAKPAAVKSKSPVDSDAIRELAELLSETGLTEIEIEQNGLRMRVARGGVAMAAPVMHAPAAHTPPAPAVEASKPSGPNPGAVPSPMVGTVYVAPEPGKPPFVSVGSTVKEGDTLMIVEAMKTMNPIVAPRGGKVSEICIENGQPVEFGQALLIIS
ncbi:MAG: acetyl-CoA carboxylase biotin carboxyl carrier protein [Proteobacteria bacterium]|nr:acetyl-CoA carboxylase biotin carboxyl carrier protein [Pseudomonadota bacterium]